MISRNTSSLVALLLAVGSAFAQQPNQPYPVSVWAMVQFGPDGRATEIAIVDESQYPEAFARNVKQRLANARVPPSEVDGKPALFKSGVELRLTVTPAEKGGTVRIDGLDMGPMPTKKNLGPYPEELKQLRGWEGEVRGTCQVSAEGRCKSIEIDALAGMPEGIRKYARVSVEQWVFEPQRINGQPIAGEYRFAIPMRTGEMPPDDFRQDRFLRILRDR